MALAPSCLTLVTTAEFLEPRVLLSATLTGAIAPLIVGPGSAATTIDLSTHFDDPAVTGTAVLLETNEGNIPLALTNSLTPNTVDNFLQYISRGEFANAIIHRAIPGFVIQGGGYLPDGTPIDTFGTIDSEAGQANDAGSIAMALSTGPDSATSQWFINLVDNSTFLDGAADGGPYTVFGHVLYNGLGVANTIANLPVIDASAENNAWENLPTVNYTGANPVTSAVPADDLVTANAVVVAPLKYSVSSSDPGLVNPTLSGSSLSLAYGSGSGSAMITVTATDLGGGTASDTFAVDVGATAVDLGGSVREVKFSDPDGTATEISLRGPGSAKIALVGAGLTKSLASGILTVHGSTTGDIVAATATTAATTLTITGSGGNGSVNLAGLTSTGSFKAIDATTTVLADSSTLAGSVGAISLASATGALSGGSIGKLTVKGALAASISAASIGTTTAGSLSGAWDITGAAGSISTTSASKFSASLGTLSKLSAKGSLADVVVRTGGSIGSISAGGLSAADFYAGIAATVPAGNLADSGDLPASAAIDSVKVGKSGFVGSILAASDLGTLNLGFVTTNHNNVAFGLAAKQIASLAASFSLSKKLNIKHVTTQPEVAAALSAQKISPGDFNILVI